MKTITETRHYITHLCLIGVMMQFLPKFININWSNQILMWVVFNERGVRRGDLTWKTRINWDTGTVWLSIYQGTDNRNINWKQNIWIGTVTGSIYSIYKVPPEGGLQPPIRDINACSGREEVTVHAELRTLGQEMDN